MTDPEEYRAMSTEALQEHSCWLYEQYLEGADYLSDIHIIADILDDRYQYDNFVTERLYL